MSRSIIVPEPDALTEPYWAGARLGELRLQRCRSCAATWHPPLPICPSCRAIEPEWYASSGVGVIESATVIHQAAHAAFADRLPYVVITVRLTEGPLVVTNLVTVLDDGALEIATTAPPPGAAVRVVFSTIAEGYVLPQFRFSDD